MTDFTTPRTWITNELVTAALLNTHIRDNELALWVGTTAGDMAYWVNAVRRARLPIGGNGSVMVVSSGLPAWLGPGSPGAQLMMNTAGTAPEWRTGRRIMSFFLNADVALTVGDYQAWGMVPPDFNGWKVAACYAMRKSGTGLVTLQLRNVTTGNNILSTAVTIDDGETTSGTAATPSVVNTSNATLSSYDILAIDVNGAGTNTFDCVFYMAFGRT